MRRYHHLKREKILLSQLERLSLLRKQTKKAEGIGRTEEEAEVEAEEVRSSETMRKERNLTEAEDEVEVEATEAEASEEAEAEAREVEEEEEAIEARVRSLIGSKDKKEKHRRLLSCKEMVGM